MEPFKFMPDIDASSIKRPVCIFDLDGVLVENPHEAWGGPPLSYEFWANHWGNPLGSKFNNEMVRLVGTLIEDGVPVIILTGRPSNFRSQTETLLIGMGIYPVDIEALVMFPEGPIPHSSAAGWKHDVVEQWMRDGLTVRFIVEDYKPNADSLRRLAPVLLYERKKDKIYTAPCKRCGGVAACWCDRLPRDA